MPLLGSSLRMLGVTLQNDMEEHLRGDVKNSLSVTTNKPQMMTNVGD